MVIFKVTVRRRDKIILSLSTGVTSAIQCKYHVGVQNLIPRASESSTFR